MSDTEKSRAELLDAIHSSRGMQHANRTYQRTFSSNIFRMNAQELIDITRRVGDPDEGLRLMYVSNREASEQTHREVARLIHNFVAAALTLVEHTRNFMREHYGSTALFEAYQARITAEFAPDPLHKFVQDLRNYMLHKGLPPSEMFLNIESNPDMPGSGVMETGIRIKAAPLLEWDGWSGPAQRFIEESGEYVEIRAFAESYSNKVAAFHEWLHGELDRFHAADLEELRSLHHEMNRLDAARAAAPKPAEQDSAVAPEQDFAFSAEQAEVLETVALGVFGKIRKIDWPVRQDDDFASQRPVSATVTDDEMLVPPVVWSNDASNRLVFAFVYKGKDAFGLDEEVFGEVNTIIDSVLKIGWARRTLSRSFIQNKIVEWLQARFNSGEAAGEFSGALSRASKDASGPLTLWAPIACLEVQSSFPFGPVEIAPLTKAMIDEREAMALKMSRGQRDSVEKLFIRLRGRMQGLAAVTMKADAESTKLKEDGEEVARIAVGLLKFFSPAAVNFPLMSACALLGAEVVPRSNLLVTGDHIFSYSESMRIPSDSVTWRISDAMLDNMRPKLDVVGRLVRPEGLSGFALAVRSSVLLFGAGATSPNHTERLTYTFLSIEALLLRHSAELVEFTVADRMALLLGQGDLQREEVRRNVREAYRLRRRQDVSPLAPREMGSVATFVRQVHQIIDLAISSLDLFDGVAEFVTSLENITRTGGPPP